MRQCACSLALFVCACVSMQIKRIPLSHKICTLNNFRASAICVARQNRKEVIWFEYSKRRGMYVSGISSGEVLTSVPI